MQRMDTKKNIKTKRPNEKLEYKRLGPYLVTKKINPVAYQLQLHVMNDLPTGRVEVKQPTI